LFRWREGRWTTISAIAVAKKTGDYSVLSHADICVVALTYELDSEEEKLEGPQVFFIALALEDLC